MIAAEAYPGTGIGECGYCLARVPKGLAMMRWNGVRYCPVCAQAEIPKAEYDVAMDAYVRKYIMGEP